MKKKNTMMKWAATAAAVTLLLTGCGDSTYMTVNGEKISQKQYDNQLQLYESMIAYQQHLSISIENSLIQEAVIVQDLKKHDVEVTDADYKEDYEEAVKSYGGAENYRQFLETVGVSDDQMKDTFRFQTRVRKHKEMFNKENPPKEEEMKKYYDQHKEELKTIDANHILVKTEEEAKKAKERIDGGEKFEDVAKDVSLDGTAAEGGALGAKNPSAYDPSFAKAMEKLGEGEISDPVQSTYGWHIIRVNKINDSFDALKEDIADTLNSQAYMAYLEDLVKKADVAKPGEKSKSEEAESSKAEEQSEEKSGSEEAQKSASTEKKSGE